MALIKSVILKYIISEASSVPEFCIALFAFMLHLREKYFINFHVCFRLVRNVVRCNPIINYFISYLSVIFHFVSEVRFCWGKININVQVFIFKINFIERLFEYRLNIRLAIFSFRNCSYYHAMVTWNLLYEFSRLIAWFLQSRKSVLQSDWKNKTH